MTCNPVLYGWIFLYLDFTQCLTGIYSVNSSKQRTNSNVTLTSASGSKEYDASSLTNNSVALSGDGFVNGQGASFNVTSSQLDVGSSENTFSYTLNDGTLSLLIMIRKRERNLSDLSDRSALFDPSDRPDRSDTSAKKPSFLFSIQGVAAEGVPERSEGKLPRKNRAMILFPA